VGTLLRTHQPMFPPWRVRGMCPWPHTHAVRHSLMCIDCGARAGKGCYLPTCARSSPGCVWVGSLLRSHQPPHPTLAPTAVCACHASSAPSARCPPLSYVCRLRGEAEAGVLPGNMRPFQPWVCLGTLLRAPLPSTPPLPPIMSKYVRGMCPWPHPHAVRHSPVYVDGRVGAGQGCYLPTCARSSPGCVGGWESASGPAPELATHQPMFPPWCMPTMGP
jgi:hypothetical protein